MLGPMYVKSATGVAPLDVSESLIHRWPLLLGVIREGQWYQYFKLLQL
jgi:hypothetical protein